MIVYKQIGEPDPPRWFEVQFIALDNGEPVGYCAVRVRGKKAWTDVFVSSAYRGKGIGFHLKEMAIGHAFRNKAEEMVTYTAADNAAAIQNILKSGYKFWKFDRKKREIWFRLRKKDYDERMDHCSPLPNP